MAWYYFAFAAPVLWAASNHLDKYILGKYLKGGTIGALAIFASLVGLLFLLVIFIFAPPDLLHIGIVNGIAIALNGALLIIAFIPYYYALSDDEASIVVPIYQTIPVFSYALGFFVLGEKLTTLQLFAGLLIIVGAVAISLDLDQSKIKIKRKVLFLMLLSSFLISIHFLIFKFIAIQENFWGASFWEYIGEVVLGIFLFTFIDKYRHQFLSILRENNYAIISISGINEAINIAAKLLVNYASLLAPLALVTLANGFQPFFVFLYSLLLTLFLPNILKEKLTAKDIAQKIFAILIMLTGTYLII